MPKVQKQCLNCNKTIYPLLKDINRGKGKFCSISCSSQYFCRLNKPIPNIKCSNPNCHNMLYRSKSRISKCKSQLFFCCRQCKDFAQCIENGITAIHPPHYQHGEYCYRDIAIRNHALKCDKCGYTDHPEILQVHHKDHDRTNNHVDNLQILCPNCHILSHVINGKVMLMITPITNYS